MELPEILIKKILYTTDLSDSGRQAFSYAASLANKYDADLTVFHVIDSDPKLNKRLVGYMSDELWEDIKQQSVEEAREILLDRKRENAHVRKCVGDYCEEILSAGPEESYIGYDIVLKMGHPVEKIIEYANEGNYDFIVMAGHGHSLLEDAMLGTTVRRVLRRATVPVLVVRTP